MAPLKSSAMIGLEAARWRLGSIWFAGSAVIAITLIVQSLTGVYDERVQGVWGWALPNFLPTLMLMLGVFAGAALQEHAPSDDMRVRRPFLTLAIGLSVFHLVCVLVTLGAHAFVPRLAEDAGSNYDAMKIFEMSNLWLGPLQGLGAGAIGALFFTKSKVDGVPPITQPVVEQGTTG